MWWLYRLFFALALAVVGPWYALRRRADLGALWRGRWALEPPSRAPDGVGRPLWIHAVSVGEVGVAATLVQALPAELPVVVTTVTPTGQARAQALFGGRATVAWMPIDLAGPLTRFLDAVNPRALVLVEGDYWPLALELCSRRGIPRVVVNGRVGDRSFGRLLRLRWALRWLHLRIDKFAVQSELDRERLLELGVDPQRVAVTGNLKFDAPGAPVSAELAAGVERLAAGRPVVVAGSTMAGEDSLVLDAWTALGGGARSLLLLAPRHPERFDEAAAMIAARGVALARRRDGLTEQQADVVLLDSLGELAGAYALATIAFVGGTLVPTGGHNPIEPAQHGVAITVGRSLENFRDIAAMFDRAVAWRQVADEVELAAVWSRWLENEAERLAVGRAARELVEANRGATQRTLERVAAEVNLA